MSTDALTTDHDPAVARGERRLRLLEELTEIGMELARKLRDGAGDSVEAEKGRDPADAFARLSRAIRLTIALEEKTDQAIADLRAGVVRVREEARAAAAERAQERAAERDRTFEDRLCERMAEAIDAEIADEKTSGERYEALFERLDEDEAYISGWDRPLRETLERLCKDLCLTPDWSQWRDEDESWAPGYVPFRQAWSPFNRPSPRPILKGEDGAEVRMPPSVPEPWRRLE
jgi:hypothetical protein